MHCSRCGPDSRNDSDRAMLGKLEGYLLLEKMMIVLMSDETVDGDEGETY